MKQTKYTLKNDNSYRNGIGFGRIITVPLSIFACIIDDDLQRSYDSRIRNDFVFSSMPSLRSVTTFGRRAPSMTRFFKMWSKIPRRRRWTCTASTFAASIPTNAGSVTSNVTDLPQMIIRKDPICIKKGHLPFSKIVGKFIFSYN